MAWSKRAREDFDEREEYRKEHGEKDRYEKKDNAPDQRSSGDWTDADYSQAFSSIRNGEWGDAKAAIVGLRDHLRSLASEKKDLEDRLEKLRAENAKLMAEMTYDLPSLEEKKQVEETVDIKEENDVEDIESLWK